ncbi:MAG: biopolymer transport protein ExbD [Chlamydiales bacterium]|jgi:biopolymer transport protein ExbD
MRRKSKKRSEGLEDPMINLTPLIDVVFVVLIMFMIIAPMLELDHVELAAGNNSRVDESTFVSEGSPLVIHVREDNTIWLNKQRVTPKLLEKLLVEAKSLNEKQNPQLFHDKRAHFGTYQSVKNAVEAAGYSEMDIVLKPA